MSRRFVAGNFLSAAFFTAAVARPVLACYRNFHNDPEFMSQRQDRSSVDFSGFNSHKLNIFGNTRLLFVHITKLTIKSLYAITTTA